MDARNRPGTMLADSGFVTARVVAAPRELVWRAYTEREHLVRWWAPKGFTMLDCTIDLRPGGVFHYGMRTSDGRVTEGRWIFREISSRSGSSSSPFRMRRAVRPGTHGRRSDRWRRYRRPLWPSMTARRRSRRFSRLLAGFTQPPK